MQTNSPCFISKLIFFKIGFNGFIFFFSFSLFSSIPKPPSKSMLLIFSSNLSFFSNFSEDVSILILESSVEISSENLLYS